MKEHLFAIREIVLASLASYNISKKDLVIRGEINCWASWNFEVGYTKYKSSFEEYLYVSDELVEFQKSLQEQLKKYLKENNIQKSCEFRTRETMVSPKTVYIGFREEVSL